MPHSQDVSIADQLAELVSKVLKPGGVGVGGAYGLWALIVEEEAVRAIAAALIGFCLSYAGKLLQPIHDGNHQRLQGIGEAINTSLDDYFAQLLAKTTRAEDAYLLCQALDCRDYKPEGMGAWERTFIPLLQDVFVPLEMDVSAVRAGFSRRTQTLDAASSELYIWNLLAQAQKVPAYRQLAIIAWGGFGKTTLLKHLAYVYGTRQHHQYKLSFLVPILLPLRRYRQQFNAEKPPTLPELIMQHHVQHLAELDSKLKRLPPSWAKDILSRGDALVMLDGFDEIPESERRSLTLWIQRQMRRFDRSVFILTSRPRAYQENFLDPLRTKIWVRPFNQQQQTRFIHQWYLSQERLARGGRDTPEVRREAVRNAESLLSQLQTPNRPGLAALAQNPLLLNLLVTYHRSNPGVELPRQRAELYQDICNLQLRKRPEAREIVLPLSPRDRQEILQSVALTLMQRNLRLVPEQILEQLVEKALVSHGHNVSAPEFLRQIIDVSELIVRQGLEGCEFSHLSFQEFLAAAQIKALNQEASLYPHLKSANQTSADNQAWWRQTILLYAAQTNPTPLIREALRQGAAEIAYACYQETQYTLNPQVAAELEALKPTLKAFRYARLEELLQAAQWREADRETYRLMITAVGKEAGQTFSSEELAHFPCDDLLAIDQLWLDYSQGKFGFTSQKTLWSDCNRPTANGKDWERFCAVVGWREATSTRYLKSEELQADLHHSPVGELPTGAMSFDRVGGLGIQTSVKAATLCSQFLGRVEACRV